MGSCFALSRVHEYSPPLPESNTTLSSTSSVKPTISTGILSNSKSSRFNVDSSWMLLQKFGMSSKLLVKLLFQKSFQQGILSATPTVKVVTPGVKVDMEFPPNAVEGSSPMPNWATHGSFITRISRVDSKSIQFEQNSLESEFLNTLQNLIAILGSFGDALIAIGTGEVKGISKSMLHQLPTLLFPVLDEFGMSKVPQDQWLKDREHWKKFIPSVFSSDNEYITTEEGSEHSSKLVPLFKNSPHLVKFSTDTTNNIPGLLSLKGSATTDFISSKSPIQPKKYGHARKRSKSFTEVNSTIVRIKSVSATAREIVQSSIFKKNKSIFPPTLLSPVSVSENPSSLTSSVRSISNFSSPPPTLSLPTQAPKLSFTS